MFQFIYAEAIILHMYALKCNSFLLTQISCDEKDAKYLSGKLILYSLKTFYNRIPAEKYPKTVINSFLIY
jgi:hypothetical protein